MLYWAEGAKSRNALKFVNSDPRMVAFFCRFLRESLGVGDDDIRLSLNVYLNNGLSIEHVERYWLQTLDLPAHCVRKHTVDAAPTSTSGLKRSKLPYGVCTIRVQSTRLVQHIYGAIQEYASFQDETWLD